MRLGVTGAVVDGSIVPGDVEVDVASGTVARVGIVGRGGAGLAAPGFIDLQVNGMAGVAFGACDLDGYATAGAALVTSGVTAYQPTLVTGAEAALTRALQLMGEAQADGRTGAAGPRLLGAHLEGPFISPLRLGAHPAEHQRDPDMALLERLLAAGPVRQVTLAPERPGGLELVGRLAPTVTVSLGHTDATATEAHAAFDRGASTVTHLFNAMRPPSHRDPGVAYVALARPDVAVQLIVDGHHLAPEAVTVAWNAAAGRAALVTDAVFAGGLGDGVHHTGRAVVEVRDGAARLPSGQLAGSVLTLDAALHNLLALGVPLVEALGAVTTVPARICRAPELGTLHPGTPADITVLDDDLRVARTLVGGDERFAR